MNKWIDNPITWRKYLTLVGVAYAIFTIGVAIYYLMLMDVQISDIGEKVKGIFKKN